ncbi:MAG: GDSL-type esterase/lipase family protein [Muricomes sp.]
MKKYLKIMAVMMLAVLLGLQYEQPAKAWEGTISCTVLGDSISKGYSSDKENQIKCYGQILTEQLSEENGLLYDYHNYAKNGLDTKNLNEKVLVKEEVLNSLSEADIIFITMGSNDLLNTFKQEAQEILGDEKKLRSAGQAMEELQAAVKKNPLLVLKVVDALNNWDYSTFENQWTDAMKTITERKKESAQIIVTNIYNPVYNMELPGTMNKVVEGIIQNMNSIIEKRSDEFGYQVIDLFDSDIVQFVQDDGLHPSQEGQQLIAEMVYPEIKAFQGGDNIAHPVEGSAIKGKDDGEEPAEQKPAEESGEKAPVKQKSEEQKAAEETPEKEKFLPSDIAITGGILVILVLAGLGVIKYRKN